MIDRNSVYCGLYTIVDEIKTHLSASDLHSIQQSDFRKSRTFKSIVDKTCPYFGFSMNVLTALSSYVEKAAFGFICIAHSDTGIQKRYYTDNLKKGLQNALGIADSRHVVNEIAARTGLPQTSIQNIINQKEYFGLASPQYWADVFDKLHIRVFICMRYGVDQVFGQGVQFSNPFAKGEVVLRWSKSHDFAQGLDTFFTNHDQYTKDNQIVAKDSMVLSNEPIDASSNEPQPKQEVKEKTCVADQIAEDLELLEKIESMNQDQLDQLVAFSTSLYGFDLKKAILFEAHRANQIKAISAFIDVISK